MVRTAQLSEFCTIVQGGRLKLSGDHFVPEGYPAYGAGGLNGYLPIAEFHGPGVVLSSIGARCGKCFLADGEWTSLANTQVILPDPKRADARYLWYQLNDESRWHRSGTAQPFIKPSDVRRHQVSLPPLPEQRRIATILDQADKLRAKRRGELAQLDCLARSLFIEMFGDPVTTRNGPRRAIKHIANVVTGNTPSRAEAAFYGHHIEWLKTDNILESGAITPAVEWLSTSGRARGREAPAGSILVVCIAGSPRSIGRVGRLDRLAAFNQQINAVIPCSEVLPDFLFFQLKISQRLVQAASTKSMKGMVSKSALEAVEVLVPPLSRQEQFCRRVAKLDRLTEHMDASLLTIDVLLASLQHRAFRGEL